MTYYNEHITNLRKIMHELNKEGYYQKYPSSITDLGGAIYSLEKDILNEKMESKKNNFRKMRKKIK